MSTEKSIEEMNFSCHIKSDSNPVIKKDHYPLVIKEINRKCICLTEILKLAT